MSQHSIVHIEISANDPAKASRFYANLFDWNIQAIPDLNRYAFETGSDPGGAFVSVDEGAGGYKSGEVRIYVSTNNIDATLDRVEALGGRVLMPKTHIPQMGWYALFADPTGNRIALFMGSR